MIRLDLTALLFSMLLSSLGTSVINIALPALVQEFHSSLQNTQWLVLAYLLSNSTFIVVIGKISDRVNKKSLYLIGLSLFAISSFLAVFASHLWMLVLLRALQGLGSAILMSLSVVLLSEFAEKEELPKYMGLIGTMSAVGTAGGPSAGGFLISLFGWKYIFLLMGLLGLSNFVLFLKFFKGKALRTHASSEKFDIFGSLLFGTAVLLFILIINKAKILETTTLLLLSTLLITLVVSFFKIEKRINSPLINLNLLNRNHIKSHFLLNFIVSIIVMTTLVVGPFFLSQVQNLKYSDIGLVMAVSPIVSILSGYLAGGNDSKNRSR
jgi:MFS family permease